MFKQMKRQMTRTIAVCAAAVVVTLASGAMPAAAEIATPGAVVTAATPVIEQYWSDLFAISGYSYEAPSIRYYNSPRHPGSVTTPCGKLPVNNSFYCPVNTTIYLDYRFLKNAIKTEGDYAVALVLAHEWGHHIAHSLGFYTTTDGKVNEPGELYSIQSELLADCFAGSVTSYFDELGMLERGDVNEAYGLVLTIGDRDGTSETQSGAHGSAKQRTTVFLTAYERGNPSRCPGIVNDVLS